MNDECPSMCVVIQSSTIYSRIRRGVHRGSVVLGVKLGRCLCNRQKNGEEGRLSLAGESNSSAKLLSVVGVGPGFYELLSTAI